MIPRHDARKGVLPEGNTRRISCGAEHTGILLEDGSIWQCGRNDGQFGIGNAIRQSSFVRATTLPLGITAKEVVCSNRFTIALMSDGSVYGCGINAYGQLGIGSTATKNTFVKATTLPSGMAAVNVACGYFHTAVILDAGSVYTCGRNDVGQLGIGSTNLTQNSFVKATTLPSGAKAKSIACGTYHTMVLLDDGSVYGCGRNDYGQLGIGGSVAANPSFVKVTTLPVGSVVNDIVCGGAHTMVLLDGGSVYGCGRNYYGQLGTGDASLQQPSFVKVTTLPVGSVVNDIVCGSAHTMVLLDDGSVYGCGRNYYGQLGTGDASLQQPSFVKVTTLPDWREFVDGDGGASHTVFLLDGGSVYGCGLNDYGQLGIGNTVTPQVSFVESIPTWEGAA